jgi:hypothetical protein
VGLACINGYFHNCTRQIDTGQPEVNRPDQGDVSFTFSVDDDRWKEIPERC